MDQGDSKKFEFTPIGYMREKQNGINVIPNKRSSEIINGKVDEHKNKKIRRTSVDNSVDSMRMFNDTSQFDDSLPQIDVQTLQTKPKNKRNLIDELKESAQASNPLKEQQEQMHKLTTDNYNLRLKCNSLLKFLNNVTDEGELKKSLNLLGEIQEWKQKYQDLNIMYMELKQNFDELEMKTSTIGQANGKEHDGYDIIALQNRLEETETELQQSRAEVKRLEQIYKTLKDTENLESQQYKSQIDMFKSDINNLKLEIVEKDKEIENNRSRLFRLTDQLQEVDHKGSESLLRLEQELDQKNDSIKALERELVTLTHGRQTLESKLKNLQNSYDVLIEQYENRDKESQNTSTISEKNQKIQVLDQENHNMKQQNLSLKESLEKLRKECESLRTQMISSDENRDVTSKLRDEIRKLTQKLNDSTSLSKQLQNQIIDNATKNTERISQRIREKDLEIEELKNQLRSSRIQLEDEVLSRIHELTLENDLAKQKLNRQISLLQEEKESIKESHQMELKNWKEELNSLNEENDRILHQERANIKNLKQELQIKIGEIETLNSTINRLKKDHSKTDEILTRFKESKNAYKEELKKVTSKFDYLSKEFLKLKENQSEVTPKKGDGIQSLKTKYNIMKQRLLDELKNLQEENLSLERKVLESRNFSSTQDKNLSRTNTTSQDRIDYYKLKYNTEVKQNNDLRIINEYLNRVLRASSQHIRLDLLKIKNEVHPPVHSIFSTGYPAVSNSLDRRRLKFKTVALFILSCVRMRQVAIKRKWDDQRLRYLQRKITIDEDRISW